MATSPYQTFATDEALEKEGIVIDYGAYAFKVARAGGANRRYARTLDAKQKPYARQISNGTLDDKVAEKLLAEVYFEAIIVEWGYRTNPDDLESEITWGSIPGPDGSLMPFNKANCVKLLLDLPDQFLDIRTQATQQALYRKQQIEDASGNSATG